MFTPRYAYVSPLLFSLADAAAFHVALILRRFVYAAPYAMRADTSRHSPFAV